MDTDDKVDLARVLAGDDDSGCCGKFEEVRPRSACPYFDVSSCPVPFVVRERLLSPTKERGCRMDRWILFRGERLDLVKLGSGRERQGKGNKESDIRERKKRKKGRNDHFPDPQSVLKALEVMKA